jgi:hypothetical protein
VILDVLIDELKSQWRFATGLTDLKVSQLAGYPDPARGHNLALQIIRIQIYVKFSCHPSSRAILHIQKYQQLLTWNEW